MSTAKRPTIRLLGVPMHAWTMQQTVQVIADRLDQGQFTQHTVVNVAKLVNMHHDEELAQAVTASDIINIDGMGVVWAGRALGHDIPERVAGIDLFVELLGLAERRGELVFFLGATDEVVRDTVHAMQARFPDLRIAGFHHGYFWEDVDAVVDQIRSSGATMLFVAISSPQKEKFIERYGERLAVKFVMGVGGTFDVMAGRTRRAPPWMQRAGLEWLFRTAQEPRRMWRRYLVTNSRFAWMVLRERAAKKG